MEPITITAPTFEEAVEQAAQQLGVDKKKVKATITEEIKGLFGKGTVTISATAPQPRAKAKPKAEPEPEPEPELEQEPAPKPASRARKSESAAPVARARKSEDTEEADEQEDVEATEEDAEEMAEFVRELIEKTGLDVQVHISSISGRYVGLSIDGKHASHLLGKNGEVLNAFQYLLNVGFQRSMRPGVRVTLDANGYRKNREDALTIEAQKIAEMVLERKEEAVLNALPAFERRIIHRALTDFDGITTYSEGEEPDRRVVVAPVD
ncbi:MAG: RNA-binding cell elongation regulator Jag/EloR [Fimbriimonadaceae bacterium]